MASVAIATEISNAVKLTHARKSGRKHKTMSDTQVVPNETGASQGEIKETQKTVFDLAKFDNVLLKKKFQTPKHPTDIKEVLADMGGDMKKLLNLVYDGLMKQAQDAAYESNEGWYQTDEKGDITAEPYTGQFASEEKRSQIQAAVLTLAKLNGYDKNLSPEEKNAKKEIAMKFLRDNPAMLGGLQG